MSRLWHPKFLILLAAVLLLVASGRLLAFVAHVLVCDEPLQPSDTIAIVSGERRFDLAARAVAAGEARQVLLFEDRFRWAVAFGALLPEHELARQQLLAHDLQPEQIHLITGPTHSDWDRAARLAAWLQEHPTGSVALLSSRFDSQRIRFIFDQVLPAADAARVSVVGLADRRFDESNWWQSRIGIKSLVSASLSLLHSYCLGPPPPDSNSWDPAEYERRLRS